MNSKNSKTSKPHVLVLNLTDKLDLRRSDKYVALSNLSIYYTWENIKDSYNTNKFKILTQTWNDKSELPGKSSSVLDIQDYIRYILKEHGENDDNNPSMKIYLNKMENRITFKIKSGYTLELLTKETIKLLGTTENKITKNENGENVHILKLLK